MLYYRGFSQIGNWEPTDVNQILRGLTLCQMSVDRGKAKFNPWDSLDRWTEATLEEWDFYKLVIDTLYEFIAEIKKVSSTFIKSPPVCFKIVNKTIFIKNESYPTFSDLLRELRANIKAAKKGYKIVICGELP